jgi:hypothetical protein
MGKKKNLPKSNLPVGKPLIKPCMICGGTATGRYSIDIDLPGFFYCKKHDFSVFMYLTMLRTNDAAAAESWLSFAKELSDVKSKKNTKVPSKKGKRNSKSK